MLINIIITNFAAMWQIHTHIHTFARKIARNKRATFLTVVSGTGFWREDSRAAGTFVWYFDPFFKRNN